MRNYWAARKKRYEEPFGSWESLDPEELSDVQSGSVWLNGGLADNDRYSECIVGQAVGGDPVDNSGGMFCQCFCSL